MACGSAGIDPLLHRDGRPGFGLEVALAPVLAVRELPKGERVGRSGLPGVTSLLLP